MTITKLHETIERCDYNETRVILLEQKFSSADLVGEYKGNTAISLCLMQRSKDAEKNGEIYQAILTNLLFPLLDRVLIGRGQAKRGDIMLIEDKGNIKVSSASSDFDEKTMNRRIGEDDYRLSEKFQNEFLNELKGMRSQQVQLRNKV